MLHKSIITKDKTIWKYYIIDCIYTRSRSMKPEFFCKSYTSAA